MNENVLFFYPKESYAKRTISSIFSLGTGYAEYKLFFDIVTSIAGLGNPAYASYYGVKVAASTIGAVVGTIGAYFTQRAIGINFKSASDNKQEKQREKQERQELSDRVNRMEAIAATQLRQVQDDRKKSEASQKLAERERKESQQRIDDTEKKCNQLVADTEKKCNQLEADTQKRCNQIVTEVKGVYAGLVEWTKHLIPGTSATADSGNGPTTLSRRLTQSGGSS